MIVGVSGGSGFVGKALIYALINKKNIKEIRVFVNKKEVINHKKIKKFKINLLNEKLDIKDFFKDVEVFFNCAAEINNKYLMYKVNVDSTKKIIKKVKNLNLKWVQLSSAGVYGTKESGEINEHNPLCPMNHYEKTKALADLEIENTKMNFIILRPSILFGNNVRNKSVLNLIGIIKKGLFLRIGNQNTIMNYIFLDDLIKAMVECGISSTVTSKKYILSQKICLRELLNIFSPYTKNNFFIPKTLARILSLFLSNIPKFKLNKSRIDNLTSTVYFNGQRIINDTNFNYASPLSEQLKKYDIEQNQT